jgi:hypothetical protein
MKMKSIKKIQLQQNIVKAKIQHFILQNFHIHYKAQ